MKIATVKTLKTAWELVKVLKEFTKKWEPRVYFKISMYERDSHIEVQTAEGSPIRPLDRYRLKQVVKDFVEYKEKQLGSR